MPALESVAAVRVVATPAALDGARWSGDDVDVLRLAPDEALGLGATGVEVDDPDAIVEPESGFVVVLLDDTDLETVEGHTDWPLPRETGELGQGKVAGVPAKVVGGRPAPARHQCRLRRRAPGAARMALTAAAQAVGSLQPITWHEPRDSYDVVIIGGGGHGLATAYYLATRHGITNVAVVEADYIASGNTGRNTTIVRANYAIPEAIRFYDHSMTLYEGLEAETGAAIFYRKKGHVWLAHSEMGMRTERARVLMNRAMGVDTELLDAGRSQGDRPPDRPDRRRPIPGIRGIAPCPGGDGPPRSRRLGVRVRGDGSRSPRHPAPAGDRAAPRRLRSRSEGRRRRDRRGADPGGRRPVGRRRAGVAGGGDGRGPAAGPDPPAPRIRHERLRAGARTRSSPRPSLPVMSRRPNAARC